MDEVQAIIAEADVNGDGKLDYAEFSHMLLNTSEECIRANRQKALKDNNKPLSKNKTPKSHASQRKISSERRERRREEIRMHLYSPENKPLTFSNAPNRESLEVSVSDKSRNQIPDENLKPSSFEPVLTSRSSPSAEPGFFQEDYTSKEESPQPLNAVKTSGMSDCDAKKLTTLPKLPPLKHAPLPPLQPRPCHQPQLVGTGVTADSVAERDDGDCVAEIPVAKTSESIISEARQTDHLLEQDTQSEASLDNEGEGVGTHLSHKDCVAPKDEDETSISERIGDETSKDAEEIEIREHESTKDEGEVLEGEKKETVKVGKRADDSVKATSVVAPPPKKSSNIQVCML